MIHAMMTLIINNCDPTKNGTITNYGEFMKYIILALALSFSVSSFASDFCKTVQKAGGREMDHLNKLLEKGVDLNNVEETANEADKVLRKAEALEELMRQVDKYCPIEK